MVVIRVLAKFSVFLFLTAFLSLAAFPNDWAAERSVTLNGTVGADVVETVEIIRDNWSIPHVFANTSEGAFFGLGYASAEDRMFQMEYSRRVVQGRISELLGNVGVESDRIWKTLGWYRMAMEVEANMDKATKRLLQAYARGVNEYLRCHNDSLLYLFDVYGIRPDPWTIADSIACWYRLCYRFGSVDAGEVSTLHQFEQLVQQVGWEQAVAQMTQQLIIDESGATVRREDMGPQLIAEIEQYASEHGYGSNLTGFYTTGLEVPKSSHAWVVGGNRSTTGSAILHSDPQITIYAPSLWYESHVCGGDFDVRGIGVAGAPGMLIGWNRDFAWGATALGADSSDLFRLDVNPSDANQYYYDGAYRDMEVYEEEISPRGGTEINITCRRTVLGPVVTPIISGTNPGEEFSWRHTEVYNLETCSLGALVRVMKARNWTDFEEAIEDYTSPGIHVIYGDRDGNIGYHMMAGVPLRSQFSPLGGRMAQYGNSSTFDWQEIVPKRYVPHMLNPSTGAICSANNMVVASWYPIPLGLGTGGTGDSIRSWRLRERLAMQPVFSQEDVLAVHEDIVNPAAREITRLGRHIAYVLGQNLSQEAMNTLETLDSWDGEYNTSQSVYPLVHNFCLYFRRSATPLTLTYGGGEAGLCYFLKTIRDKVNQNPNYVLTVDEKNYVDLSLRNTWVTTVNLYGSNSSEWLQRFDKTIIITYENNLEGFGSLDPSKDFSSVDLQCLYFGTILSQPGNSYSQDVRFDDIDLSKSVMPPGVSENSSSPSFNDQMPLWAVGELHEAPLSRERTENMTISHEQVEWRPLSTDINSDGKVDMKDVSYVARRFGINSTHPLWDPIADIWKDDVIDMHDISKVARDFGKTLP